MKYLGMIIDPYALLCSKEMKNMKEIHSFNIGLVYEEFLKKVTPILSCPGTINDLTITIIGLWNNEKYFYK